MSRTITSIGKIVSLQSRRFTLNHPTIQKNISMCSPLQRPRQYDESARLHPNFLKNKPVEVHSAASPTTTSRPD